MVVSMNAEDVIKHYAAGVRDFSDLESDDFNLDDADLSGADLSGINLSCTLMVRANLSNANLSNSDLSDCDLTDANLTGANLSGATLSYSDLRSANLSGATLKQANLESADLTGANLREANLCDANLSWATLNAANLESADLRGADLEDVKYDETARFPTDFSPKSYKGFWLSTDEFIKYEWIDRIEIAKNWDRFYDLMADLGLGKEAGKILSTTYGDRYDYKRDIRWNKINITVSDLDNVSWDYVRATGSKLNDSSLSLYTVEDAIEDGDIDLTIFLYT